MPPVSYVCAKVVRHTRRVAASGVSRGRPDPPAVGIDRRLRGRLLRPIARPAIRLGDVRPEADGVEIDHGLIAVVSLVADDLFQPLGSSTWACAASICS